MKKIFVFSTYICFFVFLSIPSKNLLGQTLDQNITIPEATTTQEIVGVFIGDPSLYTSTSSLLNRKIDLNGPRGIKEIKEKVYYTVSPEKPRLGEFVTIKAEMYGTPIQNAEFAWVINNKLFDKGVGKNKIRFALDKKSSITVLILTQEGVVISKQWSFDPQNATIIWEANTYTPPFYKGKSLYTPESTLALNAIDLNGQNPLTNTYSNYVWQVDGVVKGEYSGVGRRTFLYKGDLLVQEPLFRVDFTGVSSFGDSLKDENRKTVSGSAVIRVQTKQSNILTFEKKPLLGILYNKPVSKTFVMNDDETTFVAYPLYYSLPSLFAGRYTWSINSTNIPTTFNSLTFKKVQSDQLSKLGLYIHNSKSILQSKDVSYIIDTAGNTKQEEETSQSSLTGFGK